MRTSERWFGMQYPLSHFAEMPRGGHFAAFECPDLYVPDVRACFRPLRAGLTVPYDVDPDLARLSPPMTPAAHARLARDDWRTLREQAEVGLALLDSLAARAHRGRADRPRRRRVVRRRRDPSSAGTTRAPDRASSDPRSCSCTAAG